MSDAPRQGARARQEAAEWFTRLSRRSVTTQSLRDFRQWRRDPQNRAAYETVEAVWDGAGSVNDDPQIQQLRRETARRTSKRRPSRTTVVQLALVGAGVLVVASAAAFGWAQRPHIYVSGIGEQRIVRLDDGSTLRLNTDSRVEVKLGPKVRDVRLDRGQAFFEVAHDSRRPFIVRADGASVRAVGTIFDVRFVGRAVDVTLLQGSVQVRSEKGGELMLTPNECVEVRDGVLAKPTSTDAKRATSWTDRQLIFDETPLTEAIAEVNRYSNKKVELNADRLATAPVNGVFQTGDSESFAAAVASVFDLQLRHRGEAEIVLSREPSAPPTH